MIPRPTLKNNQFAVFSAEGSTGHVLDIYGATFRNDLPNDVYFVFDDLESAKKFIDLKQTENNTIELTIVDHNYNLVEFFIAPKWK